MQSNTAAVYSSSNPYINLAIEPELRAEDLARDLYTLLDNMESMGHADIWEQVRALADSALILCENMNIDPATIRPCNYEDTEA